MTDREFDILDLLYFTLSFKELQSELELKEIVLKEELLLLIKKGWVKCLEDKTDEEVEDFEMIEKNYSQYKYLATKQGLLKHNIR